MPAGAGADKVRAACLGRHDAGIIAQEQLDRRGWARSLDKMNRWGATVRAPDHEAVPNYLATHSSPPAKPAEKEEKQ